MSMNSNHKFSAHLNIQQLALYNDAFFYAFAYDNVNLSYTKFV